MKAPTTKIRFSEAQKLLDYGFSHYTYKEFGKKDDVVKSIPVTKGIQSTVDAILEETSGTLIQKGKEQDVVQNVNLPDSISSPIYKGQVLGNITYTIDGKEVGKTNIIAKEDVSKNNLISMTKFVLTKWFLLLR